MKKSIESFKRNTLSREQMKTIKGGIKVLCTRTGGAEDGYWEYKCCESTRPDWACWYEWNKEASLPLSN